MFNLKPSAITVYGTTWCPDCKRAKKFFGEHRVQYENVDIDENPEGVTFVEKLNNGARSIPTLIFPDGSILVEPSNAQLAEKLGLQTKAEREFYDAIVIGGGPAGLTAALYLAREGLDTLLIEKSGLGGQVGITQTLDNFPGFDEGVAGAEFADRLTRQARKFGVEILEAQEVDEIEQDGRYHVVHTASGNHYHSKVVLLASGARYRRMHIPGEDELIGINVHFCATCDGAFYSNRLKKRSSTKSRIQTSPKRYNYCVCKFAATPKLKPEPSIKLITRPALRPCVQPVLPQNASRV